MTKEQEGQLLNFCESLYGFMKRKMWYGACHVTTAMMFAFAKKIGIEANACIGECEQEGYDPFDHSWLLIEGKIYDLAIAMPFELDMAKGPVYGSIDSRTGSEVDMRYGIKFLGLGPQAELAYEHNIYDYLKGSPEINLINTTVDLAKNCKVYMTRKWMEQNLSEDKFKLIAE